MLLVLAAVLAAAPLCAVLGVGRDAPNFRFSKSWNISSNYPDLESLGGRPLLVEHWATWCPPCVANVPHLNELHDTFSANGLTIIAVSNERPSIIEGFVSQHGVRYPVVQSSTAGGQYGVESIPVAFLVNPAGKIVWTGHPAELKPADIERMVGIRPARPVGGPTGSAVGAAPGGTPGEGSGMLWVVLIGGLVVMLLGALGWVWWKTSDRPRRPQTAMISAPYPPAPGQSPAQGSPGPPAAMPQGPTAVLATSQRPASSTAVAPLLADASATPGAPGSSGKARTIKLTPSGRFPTVPYTPGEAQPIEPEAPQPPQVYPPPYAQPLQPEVPPPAPPGKPVQFRPFNAGGRP
ncbi:MAG: redoxin domain-containing protein [Planctomycetes bacterium]|nr:redoxin domain-containing protein [Planctomycetota bacterium]MCL4729608.1 redoxin domain-containing protein [Planctomycetota bacterium]